jgi:hypothetical protein
MVVHICNPRSTLEVEMKGSRFKASLGKKVSKTLFKTQARGWEYGQSDECLHSNSNPNTTPPPQKELDLVV